MGKNLLCPIMWLCKHEHVICTALTFLALKQLCDGVIMLNAAETIDLTLQCS